MLLACVALMCQSRQISFNICAKKKIKNKKEVYMQEEIQAFTAPTSSEFTSHEDSCIEDTDTLP